MGKPIGMYGETPQVKIGPYTLCRQDEDSIWVQHESGEGAQFADRLFLPVLDKFYKENF